MHRTI